MRGPHPWSPRRARSRSRRQDRDGPYAFQSPSRKRLCRGREARRPSIAQRLRASSRGGKPQDSTLPLQLRLSPHKILIRYQPIRTVSADQRGVRKKGLLIKFCTDGKNHPSGFPIHRRRAFGCLFKKRNWLTVFIRPRVPGLIWGESLTEGN